VGDLIAFLFKHYYIVIIIGGIVFSLFRKSPIERPPSRMPDFGGNGPSWRPQPRPPQPVDRPDRPAGPAQTVQPTRPERSPLAVALPREEPAAQQMATVVRSQAVKVQKPATMPEQEEKVSPAKSDLAKAIMWAEILGPPRARKPYRR
jgi:hypothetical protein